LLQSFQFDSKAAEVIALQQAAFAPSPWPAAASANLALLSNCISAPHWDAIGNIGNKD